MIPRYPGPDNRPTGLLPNCSIRAGSVPPQNDTGTPNTDGLVTSVTYHDAAGT
jgi:hypothetical protein